MQALIYNIDPFDANKGTTIRFNWSGSSAGGNRCIIKNHDNNEVIYDYTVLGLKQEHLINQDGFIDNKKLINGKKYLAYIIMTDSFGTQLSDSDIQSQGQMFQCFTTPIFRFVNLVNGQTIDGSSYDFILEYSQDDAEELNSWQITIYSAEGAVLSSTNVRYDTTSLDHLFSGFNNEQSYQVRATGQTVNGIMLDTGYIIFHIEYGQPSIFSMVELKNLAKEGAILVRSNIISADGELKNAAAYINDEYLDLRNNELVYNEGFIFEDDFSLVVYAYDIKPNIPFFWFYANENQDFVGVVTYRIGKIGSTKMAGCLELRILNGENNPEYIIYSNKIDPISQNTKLGFCITRASGYYDLAIKNLGEVLI